MAGTGGVFVVGHNRSAMSPSESQDEKHGQSGDCEGNRSHNGNVRQVNIVFCCE
jgi:hypothetical protein